MVKKEIFLSLIGCFLLGGVFFYKFLLFGQLPFPGDLLIAEYKPWRTYSFLGYNPGSYPNKAQYPDTFKQLYPWKTQVIEDLKAGHLPLWNPHNFAGSPLLANFQSAALYPLSILYLLLSQPLSWSILVFLQPVLASFFTYWYSRKIGLGPIAAALASISFSYGSFMNVWLEYNTIGHVILWLPLALLAIENRWTLVGILSLTLPFLGGHPQIAACVYIFSLIYLWIRTHRLPLLVAYAIIPLGIAAIQIIPGIELVLNSARNAHPYDFFINKVLIQPEQLIMLVFPDFFGNPATRNYVLSDTYIGKVLSIGLVPLFFLLATHRSKNKMKKIFLITAIFLLILATKNPVSIIVYKFSQLRSSSPNLFIFLFQFSLAILSAIGLEQFLYEPHTIKKLIKRSILTIGLLVSAFVLTKFMGTGNRSVMYGSLLALGTLTLFFVGIGFKKNLKLAVAIVLLIQVCDLFYAFQKFNPFVPSELLYPPTSIVTFLKERGGTDRVWGYGTGAIEANFATELGLYSADGYDPLYPRWYGEYMTLGQNGSFSNAIRSDATITPGYGERDLVDNPYRLAILERLGITYVLDRVENGSTQITFPQHMFEKQFDSDGWIAYRYTRAVPKAILASAYKLVQTPKEFEASYFDPAFDPNSQVLLTHRPPLEPISDDSLSTVKINSYEPEHITLTVSTQSTKILVLSDTYYPGWVARIDGSQTPIFRANHTMRGVSIPPGNHLVTFSYEPLSVRLGMIITLVSIIALAVLSWRYEKK